MSYCLFVGCITKVTNLLTKGDTKTIHGKAIEKAKLHACSQRLMMSSTQPRLKMLMTNDMMADISNDMKNEKTIFWCF